MSSTRPLSGGVTQIGAGWFVVVIAVTALCHGVQTGVPGNFKVDEPRYFATALSVHESGDWVVLRYIDGLRLKKPPLQTWLVASSYRLFGVGLWQARLPSNLAGVGAVALTAWLATLLFASRRTALYSACILLGSSLFLRPAHWAITDAGLACFVLLAWCGFALAIGGRRSGAWLAWFAMGLATLQKGPVGFALPIAAVALWLLIEGRSRPVSWRLLVDPLGLVLFALLVLPWPLLSMLQLGAEEVTRPIGEELGFHLGWSASRAAEHVGEYSWDLIRSVLPWTPLMLFYRGRDARGPEVRLLGLWVFAFALVFSVIVLKHRWRYMLPAIPALAILAGRALDTLERRREEGAPASFDLRLLHWSVSIWLVIAVIQGAALVFTAERVVETRTSVAIALAAATGPALLAALLPWLRRTAPAHVWVVVAALGLALVETLRSFALPAGFATSPAWELARGHVHERHSHAAVATLGLTREERGWAWLGAARSLPHHEAPKDGGDWSGIARHDLLLARLAAERRMPQELRANYRELSVAEGVEKELDLVWRVADVPAAREAWRRGAPPLILLEKITVSAPRPAVGGQTP